jgi:succinoglycan biosynthesis protein ExoM
MGHPHGLVAIAIATMQRPDMLGALLIRLQELQLPAVTQAEPHVEIVVVDNDPAQSARTVIDALRAAGTRFPIRYLTDPRRGIPFVRNTAVAAALAAGATHVAFIDDDELPERDWLSTLMHVQNVYDADVVAGPCLSSLPGDAPAWAKGNAFRHESHRTGDPLETCATNNTLVRRSVFERLNPWFDERLALTGGTDRHFFLRAHDAGMRLVWAAEAVVREDVPSSRVTLPWVIARMYRQGACNAFCEIDLERKPLPRLQMLAQGAAFIAGGVALAPLGALGALRPSRRGQHLVKYARYAAYGAGLIATATGQGLYEEYKKVHGR